MTLNDFSLTRAGDLYTLSWSPGLEGTLSIAACDSPHHVLNHELLREVEVPLADGRCELTLPGPSGPVFFHLGLPGGETYTLAERLVSLKSVSNFRDFGGYLGAGGRQIRWQSLYRSGHLGYLTDEDRQRIAELGIELVCDFRTPGEFEMNPSQFAEGHTPKLAQLALNPGDNRDFMSAIESTTDAEEMRGIAREMMMKINRDLALLKAEPYREMFRLLLNCEGPVLIHCTAGKDRTGFGGALILAVLGVPERAILDDYLLTNDYADFNHSAQWFKRFAGIDLDPEILAPMFGVHEDYLEEAFAAIKASWGTLDRYLEEQLGVGPGERQALQDRYLLPVN